MEGEGAEDFRKELFDILILGSVCNGRAEQAKRRERGLREGAERKRLVRLLKQTINVTNMNDRIGIGRVVNVRDLGVSRDYFLITELNLLQILN